MICSLLLMVSVICPTFGRPERHEGLYKSFVAQDYKEKELLIFDDSPKPSPFFMALNDARVKYRHQTDRVTIGFKRNELIQAAKGEIIAHFDDDDYYGSKYLSFMVEELRDADFIKLHKWVAWREIDGTAWMWDATVLPRYSVSSNSTVFFEVDAIATAKVDPTFSIDWMMSSNQWGYGFSYVYRKSDIRFPSLNFGEDLEFTKRLKAAGKVLKSVPDKYNQVLHTLHRESSSKAFPQSQITKAAVLELCGDAVSAWLQVR